MRIFQFPIALTLAVAVFAQAPAPAPAKKVTPAPVKPAAAPAKPAPAVQPADTKTDTNNPVVMTVGTDKITKKDFEALISALPEQVRAQASGPNKRKFAEQVAEMKSLAYEARRRKIDQSPETQQKIALQTDNILASELFRTVTEKLKPQDDAMLGYYDQHKAEYEQVTASHILIRFKTSPVPLKEGQKELTEDEALAKAKALREKIVKGGDFAAIAKAESDDTGSGANGGSLGSFGHGQMVPAFEQAAFALPVGQISEPVKTQFGYHIIKVEAHDNKKFDDMKPEIEKKLKQDLSQKAVEDLKKSVPVTIDDAYFGK